MTRGICLPSVCRAKFVENLFRKAIELLKKFELRLEYCQTKNQTQFEEWLTIKISLSLIIVFLLILITSGTLIETLQVERIKNQDDFDEQIWDRKQSILKCFSLISNGKNLFDFVEKRNEFPWIDGLRSLFTMMLVLAHSTLSQGVVELSPISPFQHFPDNFHRYSRIVSNWYLYNSLFLVKFFFVMGLVDFCSAKNGFLVGTNHLRKSKSGLNRMNFFRFFMNRWLRFTPSFIGYISIDRLLFLSLALMLIGPLLFAPRLKSILGSEENIGNLIESYSLLDVFITTLSNLISVAGISLFFYICSNYWSAIKTQLSFRFLSNRFWLPLSRLSFTIYLLHVPINWFLIHQQRHPQSSTEFELVCRCHH
ncbi:hypothetical protein QR98_0033680 [Sarcoptes scabiei]|uniref:Acyltransferase 3 domain-containing protein n=1 Tax=Sarcoptes scabiei TaxID=52283 RepID=A0A132A1V5_SARSC|nr:hypothetical protein QR98_0033680 [Sarcoptes scabiei]